MAALIACVAAVNPAQALPEGGQVAAGQASIATSNKAMTITAADRSILNFSKFNIAAEESVRFVQPSSASSVLARATDGTPSEIFGRLEANGRLVLANAAGVYFRGGSIVSVGALVAAAGNIADADFLRNDGGFAISLTDEVHNAGRISALDGNVALLGQNVINTGSIVAPSGAVVLFSGENILLSEPDGDIAVVRQVSETTDPSSADLANSVSVLTGRSGGAPARRTSGAGVEQAGKISASSVFLGAADLYAVGVRHTGATSATSNIRVKTAGKAVVSGEITAATQTPGAVTNIHVQANTVEVADAAISATGADSGGRVEIKAQEIAVSRSSSIDVSGSNSGNGGSVIISAEGLLSLEGALSARGGSFGGNGGVISLNAGAPLAGTPQLLDLSAPAGELGKLEQNAPSVSPENEGSSTVVTKVSTDDSTIPPTDSNPTPPIVVEEPDRSTPPAYTLGQVVFINSNTRYDSSSLNLAGENLIVPSTSQPNPGGATSSVPLTGGNPFSSVGVGESTGSTPPTGTLGGILIGGIQTNTGPDLSHLTFTGGNQNFPPTSQSISGTVPQTPTSPSPGPDGTNLSKFTGGILTLTTPPQIYTGNVVIDTDHGTISLPGGVDFPSGTAPAHSGAINSRRLVISQVDQTAMAGAMRIASPSGDSMLRLSAPQSLAEFVMLYSVPTHVAVGAGPQISQGFPIFSSPLQQAGSPLNASFAGDAFSGVFFSPASRTAPERSLLENNTRE